MSDSWAVQVAVMAAINADAVLPAIYDVTPTNTPRPFGTYGEPIASASGRLGKRPQRHQVVINWWSDATTPREGGGTTVHGNSVVASYAKRTREVVLASPLALSTGTMTRLRWVNDTYLPEPDRNVRRVRQLFEIDTE